MTFVSRTEMLMKLGLVKIVDPTIDDAYKLGLQGEYVGNGHPTTSFHASSFPGDDPKACGRKAMYDLMNIPEGGPIKPYGMAIMEVGKFVEEAIVSRWHGAGILLSPPPSEGQTKLEITELMTSGKPDAVILPPGWNKPLPVEIKSKDSEAIFEMRKGQRTFELEHRNQILLYISVYRQLSKSMWPELDVVDGGSLLYVARNRPRETHEFYFDYDPAWEEAGTKKILEWMALWKAGVLPPRDPTWRWTEHPCDWCAVKPLCKKDVKDDVTKLEDSNTIAFAKEVRPDYDLDLVRDAIAKRWKDA